MFLIITFSGSLFAINTSSGVSIYGFDALYASSADFVVSDFTFPLAAIKIGGESIITRCVPLQMCVPCATFAKNK